MNEALKTRLARSDEASLLSTLAFESKAHWGYPADFMESCRDELSVSKEKLASEHYTYIVIENEDEILGFYALEKMKPGQFELEALFVRPAYIGKGVGSNLLEHAKTTAIEMGAETILIQGDPHAASFYLAAGAQLTGERESASISGRSLPLFTIYLSSPGNMI